MVKVIIVEEKIKKIKETYTPELMKIDGVIGVGIGKKIVKGKETDQLAIIVFVTKKRPKSKLGKTNIIPEFLEGVPVDVQEVGVVKALKEKR